MDSKETYEKLKLLNGMIQDYLDQLDMEECSKKPEKKPKKGDK